MAEILMPDYAKLLENKLILHANQDKALPMKKYMRNQFDFLGLPSPHRKKIVSEFIKKNSKPQAEGLSNFLYSAWNSPFREMHYSAMEITYLQRKKFLPEHIEVFEKLITLKSWWDTVDFIAPSLVSAYFNQYKDALTHYPEKWLQSKNTWLMRASLIFQLKYYSNTDSRFLFHACQTLSYEKDFFIRKAIGWALRQYSKTNANAVIDFVNNNKLSALSYREALKWLKSKKTI